MVLNLMYMARLLVACASAIDLGLRYYRNYRRRNGDAVVAGIIVPPKSYYAIADNSMINGAYQENERLEIPMRYE